MIALYDKTYDTVVWSKESDVDSMLKEGYVYAHLHFMQQASHWEAKLRDLNATKKRMMVENA